MPTAWPKLTARPLEADAQPLLVGNLLTVTCFNLESVLVATGRSSEIDRVYGETLVLLETQGPVSEMKASC